MRHIDVIASDLAQAREAYYCWQHGNAAGKTQEEMTEILAAGAELERKLFRLEKEKREWVEAP